VQVSFHRFAEDELNEAAAYYEGEHPGLGAKFLAEVDRVIDSIVKHPRAGQIILDPVRRRLLPRFPYGILYTIKPKV
jgi:toxin ParE1/3/4